LLHLLGIILPVPGARRQAGKPQAMKEIINAGQRVLDPEFLLENASGLFGSQRAHPVRRGGLGQETLLERLLFRRRQVRGPAGLSLGGDGLQAVILIRIHPPLHKSSAAAQGPCDRWGIVTLEGQENGSMPISLFGIPLLTTLLTQSRQVFRVVKLDLHPTVPPVFPRVCQMPDAGATLF
jgi:hypothetical protein